MPWGTPDKTGAQSDFTSITTTRCVWSKEKYLSISMSCHNSIAKQFAFKEFMRVCIKCFFKIQYECVSLSSIVQDFIFFITVVNWVSQLCPSWMHVAYLTGVYIHQDEPWYLNILCVRVTFKVHKSRKPGDNCTQVTCHSSWKGGRYLQETSPLGFYQCQLIAEKYEQIPDVTLLLAPLGLYDQVHQALKL